MPKKYQKGATIERLTLLAIELEAGRYIFYKGRPLHPSFILHMTLSTVLGGLNNASFAMAEERR